MLLLDLTLPDLAANVALDEALLEAAAGGEPPPLSEPQPGVLRLWESSRYGVVLGRGSAASAEVRWQACAAEGVPVVRRPSGGAAVVVGPGCLMYAAILPLAWACRREPSDRFDLDRVHESVLARVAAAVARCGIAVRREGVSDLTLDGPAGRRRKVSGNSLRVARDWFLYHGTLLYAFDLACVDRWLAAPPRQPAYRDGRGHADFVANLPARGPALREALVAAWQTAGRLDPQPHLARVALLAGDGRYGVAPPDPRTTAGGGPDPRPGRGTDP